jgi:hypothetical protein
MAWHGLEGFATREQDRKKHRQSQAPFDAHIRIFRAVDADVLYGLEELITIMLMAHVCIRPP